MALFGGSSLSSAFNGAAGAGSSENGMRAATRDYFELVATNNAYRLREYLRLHPDAAEWRNEEGLTGLMIAARHGHREAALELIAAKADLEAINANGSTALTFAAYSGKAVVAEVLLKAGADVNHSNSRGQTPLLSAASQGNKNTVRLLLENGADPRTTAADGATAIQYAQENGFTEITGILVRAKQLRDEKDAEDNAPVSPVLTRNAAPANTPAPKPSADEQHMKDLEKRMRNAGLF